MTIPMTKGQCRSSARQSQKHRIPTGHSFIQLGKHSNEPDGQHFSSEWRNDRL